MSLRDYVGIPYEIRGTPPHSADCYSLICYYAKQERGFELPPYVYTVSDNYERATEFIAEAEAQMGTRWRKVEKQPDAVVVFRVKGLPMHCGIMVNEWEFLHSIIGRNSSIENIQDFYWRKRVTGYFRYD